MHLKTSSMKKTLWMLAAAFFISGSFRAGQDYGARAIRYRFDITNTDTR